MRDEQWERERLTHWSYIIKRSYKIEITPPAGKSYASDIAEKYGVTYDMLVNKEK